ncbi:protein kinase [Jannaschia sp. R86511]|uniref:serine/threonine-protein kinase n=1 Tax=Jannaschia sp. R86511 TaxID=3093853 RepID=UPI0036D2D2DE
MSGSHPDLPAGTSLLAGRYAFVDVLGSGGMGAVWRVWDVRESRYRAAKLLRQQRADLLLRFVAEQGTRIEHPHVLAPESWAAEDDRVVFAMQLVDGGSVADLLGDHGALPLAVTVELVDQLLQGLVAVHDAGVVHRDVKPANLLLRATGRGRPHLLLSDFGIAVREDLPRLTSRDDRLLTLGYSAPELDRGADPHTSADVWSAGVVALELATGVRPATTAGSSPTPPAGVLPAGLRDVVLAMTSAAPEARPGAAEALDRWRAATSALTLPAPVDAGGEPFEVLAQLPPLPAAWGTDGPAPAGPVGGEGVAPTEDIPGAGPAATSTGVVADPPSGPPAWWRPAVLSVAAALGMVLVAIAALAWA